MTYRFKKSGVKSLCAIMAAASMMSVAVPAFAESNENLDACYAVETHLQDELMPLPEAPLLVQETAPIETAVSDQKEDECFGESEEVTPDYEAIREENRAAWIYREMHDNWGEPEEITPTETETQEATPDYKAIREQNRAAWIYREMHDSWGEPEEVTPTQPETQPSTETSTPTIEKEIIVKNLPSDKDLKRLKLDDIVRNRELGWSDSYYDTYRGDGEWKHVGSDDMIKFVKRTLGEDDPRYQKLIEFCTHIVHVHPLR